MQHCHTAHVSAGDNDNNLAFRACGEDPKQDSSNDQPPHKKRGGLWHVDTFQSRTRPDLSCIVGAMSRWLHKRPACVIKSGHHALKYLAGTVNYAIKYDRCNGQEWDLEEGCYTPASTHQADVFVDSSFSLNQEPFRCVTYYLMEEHRFHGHQGDSHSLHPVQQIEAEIIGYAEDQQQAESLDHLTSNLWFIKNPLLRQVTS